MRRTTRPSSLSGDFDTDKLLAQIERSFGKIPRGPEVPKVTAVEPKHLGERRVIVKRQAELPAVFAGYIVPTLKHPDSYALEVLQGILSSGKSSRLYKSLVYEKQLALYAGGDYDNVSTDPNLFYVYAGVMPGKTTEEVEKALYAEIDKFKNEPVTDDELQKAKNQIEASFIMGQDSIFNQAMLLGQFESVASWRAARELCGQHPCGDERRRDAGGERVFLRGQQDRRHPRAGEKIMWNVPLLVRKRGHKRSA